MKNKSLNLFCLAYLFLFASIVFAQKNKIRIVYPEKFGKLKVCSGCKAFTDSLYKGRGKLFCTKCVIVRRYKIANTETNRNPKQYTAKPFYTKKRYRCGTCRKIINKGYFHKAAVKVFCFKCAPKSLSRLLKQRASREKSQNKAKEKDTPRFSTTNVGVICFSPNGKVLATKEKDNKIKIWDVKKEKEIKIFSGHNRKITALAFGPNGKYLASGSLDRTVKIWNVKKGNILKTLSGHENSISAIIFSPDGENLASGSLDRAVKIWDIWAGRVIKTFRHFKGVTSICFSPKGKILASASYDKTVKLWYAKTGRVKKVFLYSKGVEAVAFHPNGRVLASGGLEGTIKISDIKSQQTSNLYSSYLQGIKFLVFSKDGTYLASAEKNSKVDVWNFRKRKIIRSFPNSRDLHSIAFHPDSNSIALGIKNVTFLFNIRSGKKIARLGSREENLVKLDRKKTQKTFEQNNQEKRDKQNLIEKLRKYQKRPQVNTLLNQKGIYYLPTGLTDVRDLQIKGSKIYITSRAMSRDVYTIMYQMGKSHIVDFLYFRATNYKKITGKTLPDTAKLFYLPDGITDVRDVKVDEFGMIMMSKSDNNNVAIIVYESNSSYPKSYLVFKTAPLKQVIDRNLPQIKGFYYLPDTETNVKSFELLDDSLMLTSRSSLGHIFMIMYQLGISNPTHYALFKPKDPNAILSGILPNAKGLYYLPNGLTDIRSIKISGRNIMITSKADRGDVISVIYAFGRSSPTHYMLFQAMAPSKIEESYLPNKKGTYYLPNGLTDVRSVEIVDSSILLTSKAELGNVYSVIYRFGRSKPVTYALFKETELKKCFK